MALFGRDAELAVLTRLIAGLRGGAGGVLVLNGEAGIGKTALLDEARRLASDLRVLAHSGLAAEKDIPYAALHALLRDAELDLTALPPQQAAALGTAMGQGDANPPDRFLVGLAVLAVLGRMAPVVLVVDDLHYFDRESSDALLFAARRLMAENVVMLFATRDGDVPGVPELTLPRLDDDAASELLRDRCPARSAGEHDRVRTAADGNPLALLALSEPRMSAATRVEREFADRIEALSPGGRSVVLLAAAEGTGDLAAVLAAADRLGTSLADLAEVEQAGLLHAHGQKLEFAHPLIGTVTYARAPLALKHEAHRALVEVLNPGTEPDRHAWHRAAIAVGTDDDVARALDESANRALRRGTPEEAVTAFERAAQLSSDRESKGERLVAAATAAANAGRRERAAGLAQRAAALLSGPVPLARLALLEAELAGDHHSKDPLPLLETAESIAPSDPQLAGELLLSVVRTAWEVRDARTVDQVVRAASRLPAASTEHVLAVARLVQGYFGADVAPRPAIDALRETTGALATPQALVMVAHWYLLLSDTSLAGSLAATAERAAHASGQLDAISSALVVLGRVRWRQGRHAEAASVAAEGLRLARGTGRDSVIGELAGLRGYLAAVSGDESEWAAAVAEIPTGLHDGAPMITATRGLLDLGLGRFEAAADRLAGLTAERDLPDGPRWLPDLVEAATRCDRQGEARTAAERFARWAEAVGQEWAHAVARRCEALTDSADAEALFDEAQTIHTADGTMPFERARTALLHGEWLRRHQKRGIARSHLRTAVDLFDRLGAAPWAARGRNELRATGETPPATPPDAGVLLTSQELRVVRLAAQGLSNREIGARLFLSPRTVGYHLYKSFPKLGVTSRAQLSHLEFPADARDRTPIGVAMTDGGDQHD